MSNGGLEQAGIKYNLDIGGVTQNANTIINNFNLVDQAQKKVTDGAKAFGQAQSGVTRGARSFDESIGANGRSMRIFAGEALNLAGVTGVTARALEGVLSATGPLSIALVAITAVVGALKGEIDKENSSFDSQTAQLARLATSYDSYAAARQKAAQANPLSSEGIPNLLNQVSEGIPALKAFQDAYDKIFAGQPGTRDFVAERLKTVTTGELGLGQIQNDRIRVIGQEITAQAAQGASLSAIFDSVVKLKVATGEITQAQVENREEFSKLVPGLIATAQGYLLVGQAARDSAAAQKLASQLGDAQDQYNVQSANASQQHNDRMTEIDAQGAEARARIARSGAEARANIERSYARQIQDINENLADGLAQAAGNAAERVADAEANAQERRVQLDEQLADRRIAIEESYQDRVQQVNEQYGTSVLDATIRRDATALLRAKEAKTKGLADADRQRQKELADAQKEHDKQAKELEAALAKQKAQIEKDYEQRIRDLEQNAEKQRQKAAESRNEQLADQKRSEADQLADQKQSEANARASEEKSYQQRQAQLEQAFEARKKAIIAALADEKNITETEAKAIIESLRGILNPDQITELLNDLQKAIQAKIDIKITPFASTSSGTQPGDCPPGYHKDATGQCVPGGSFAVGGYTGESGGIVHPHELVLPLGNMVRTNQLVRQYLSPYANTTTTTSNSHVTVDVILHDEMLDGRIDARSANATVRLLKGTKLR